MNTLFPIFLKLENLRTLVVGGGNVGLEKMTALLSNAPNASITLVAPQIKQEIVDLTASFPQVTLLYKLFDEQDLEGMDIVIAGTSLKEVNLAVKEAAKRKKILANIADTPELCDFYLGSIVQKGDLKIAISTNGMSPTLGKRLREMLSEVIPEGIQQVLDNLKVVRERLKGDFEYKVNKLNEITTVIRDKEE
jgi:precorrin-2 dehydrogenase/sirohydrochlorin ferrochelatase